METKLIHNEAEYQAALKRIRELGEPEKGSPEDEEAEILTMLLVKFEEENYPAEELDPIEYLKTRMEVLGLAQNDLVPYFGNKGNVSKVLNRKRPLSLQNIRALKKGLGLSADVLISGSDYAMSA
ncbi:transcriptional regulator [Adhaeribacter arboris]|uniref:Transcriptional regulator n=2 Tax=Adhaeribacter arboris TaxID=2072846 RepID=A0A2T2Y8Y5_9BACT|nr:transcriptional regulator [Adhaeribacter arboris]PSR51982.1 transcriptional regulator [Adhaeribacter arboris]